MNRRGHPPAQPTEAEIIDLVEQANPLRAPAPGLTGAALDARVAEIVAAITATVPARRSRRRMWIGTGAVIAVLGGGGAITWAVTRSSPAVDPTGVICYDSPSQHHGVVVTATGESPIELCAREWTNGQLGHGEAPALVGCVGAGGASAVYPSDDPTLCDQLGLGVLDPVIPPEQLAIIAFTNDITDQLGTMGCVDQATLTQLIEAQLHDKGLDDVYTIKVLRATNAAEPCAVMGANPADHTIEILPVPNMFEPVTDPPPGSGS